MVRHEPEESPVAGFWIDRTPVTNGQFRQFVIASRFARIHAARSTRRIA